MWFSHLDDFRKKCIKQQRPAYVAFIDLTITLYLVSRSGFFAILRREDGRCLHISLPVQHSLQMSTKPVNTRTATATRAGRVWRGMGHKTPLSSRGSKNAAEDDPRPNILQLNTKGFTENKISVTEQQAYKNKALINVRKETHRTSADKLVIPNFSLDGSVPSRNQALPCLSTSG